MATAILMVLVAVRVQVWTTTPDRAAREAARAVRAQLRQDGFRTTLDDFHLDPDPAEADRARRLVDLNDALRRTPEFRSLARLQMEATGLSTARVLWRRESLPDDRASDAWPEVLEALRRDADSVHAAARILLGGPIRFPVLSPPGVLQLTHLDQIRVTTFVLAGAVSAELRRGRSDAAWTNLLALTTFVTAPGAEPTAASEVTRFNLLYPAFAATWEALQTNAWTDQDLDLLQGRWAALDLWSALPDTAAIARAEAFRVCELSREETALPLWATATELGQAFLQQWHNPSAIIGWSREKFQVWQTAVRYRRRSSYEDEIAIAEHYLRRELDLRDALQMHTWLDLRDLPVAGTQPLQAPSRADAPPPIRNPALPGRPAAGIPRSLVARAAAAESLRRVLVTALAVERLRLRSGRIPATLDELPREVLPIEPVDFIDGQRLRYRADPQGFVVYSVGLDGIDDGGDGRRLIDAASQEAHQPDIVWPRPATRVEVAEFLNAEAQRRELERRRPRPLASPPSVPSPDILRKYGVQPRPRTPP